MGDPMPTSTDTFDPLVVVAAWLDACRWRELDALLNLYDERATLECDCEHVRLTGRKWIAAYWAPKLESKAVLAFSLNAMALTADGVRVEYQDYEGKPLRMDFCFSPSGKILHTSCAHCWTA
jgi:limonene-1,2-epoxide hydrolase